MPAEVQLPVWGGGHTEGTSPWVCREKGVQLRHSSRPRGRGSCGISQGRRLRTWGPGGVDAFLVSFWTQPGTKRDPIRAPLGAVRWVAQGLPKKLRDATVGLESH